MSTVIVVASADGLYRAGIVSILRGAGFIVIEVDDVPSAVSAAIEHGAAVCLLDSDAGVYAHSTQRLAAGAKARVIAVASEGSENDVLEAIRNGVSGFVPKTADADGLVHAVRAVLAGHLAIPRGAVSVLVGELRGGRRPITIDDRRIALTAREQNVLELLEDGMATRQIAARLEISPVTVRRHLGAIAAKAGTRGIDRLRAAPRRVTAATRPSNSTSDRTS